MRRRSKLSGFCCIVFDSLYESIERQVEVEPCLLSIGDHIQACCNLVVNCRNNSIFNHFFNICRTKLV